MKKQQCVIGVDMGTTNCKSVLFDLKGAVIDKATRPSHNMYDRIGPGWVEHDANTWVTGLSETLRELMERNNVEVLAICVTNQRPTIVPVDRDCKPVRPAISWQTTATYRQAGDLKKSVGDEAVYKKTGLTIDSVWSAPMVKYIVDMERENHAKTYKYVQIQTMLLHFLLGTDEFIIDKADASATMMYNLNTNRWDEEILAAVGITEAHLSMIVEPGQNIGVVCEAASKLTGIPAGTPVISGSADSQCSGLGAGAVAPGIMNVMIGTAEVGLCYSEKPRYDPDRSVLCHAHAMPGAYLFGATLLAAGDAYRWMRDTIYGSDVSFAKTNQDVADAPLGSNGVMFIPHQAGAATPYWDNRATGVFVGITLATDRGCIARSIMEGVAFEVVKSFEVIENMGVTINEIRLTGGAAVPGNPWNQIQADIFGRKIHLLEVPDTGALGAAILAAAGVGAYASVREAADAMIRVTDCIEPNMENHARYKQLQSIHDDIYKALRERGVYQALSDFAEQ